jgi:AcrR family transcriptional regulator
MPRRSDAKAKAIETAERLFRTRGYAATGLTQILEESGAPKGSYYFHFPGGKEQMALEALLAYGERLRGRLEALAAAYPSDPAGFVQALCGATGAELRASDWKLGCLAQNLAQELAPVDAVITDALARVFQSWISVMARALASGRTKSEGERNALALLAGLEGARSLSRAARDASAFEAVASAMIAALE